MRGGASLRHRLGFFLPTVEANMHKFFRVVLILTAIANLVACASLPVTRYVIDSWRQGRR